MRRIINRCGKLPCVVLVSIAILLALSGTANAQFHIYNGAGVGYDYSVPGYGGLYGYPSMGTSYAGTGIVYPSFNSTEITVSYSYPGYAIPSFSYNFTGWGYSYPANNFHFAYPGWGYPYYGAYGYTAYTGYGGLYSR
jgi:hypothetical protein